MFIISSMLAYEVVEATYSLKLMILVFMQSLFS